MDIEQENIERELDALTMEVQRDEPPPGQEAPAPEPDATAQPTQQHAIAEIPDIPTTDLLKPLASLACNKLCPAWQVSAEEQDTLCNAYAAVIDKHFPDGFIKSAEGAAIVCTLAIVAPRMGQPRFNDAAPPPGQSAEQSQQDAMLKTEEKISEDIDE